MVQEVYLFQTIGLLKWNTVYFYLFIYFMSNIPLICLFTATLVRIPELLLSSSLIRRTQHSVLQICNTESRTWRENKQTIPEECSIQISIVSVLGILFAVNAHIKRRKYTKYRITSHLKALTLHRFFPIHILKKKT